METDHSIGVWTNRARRLAGTAVDLALPPRCVGCGARTDANGLACAACWSALTFIGSPLCACCGMPFDFAVDGETRCAACLADPPPYGRARAALLYNDGSRGLILGFKHGDRLQAASMFGGWVARAGAELLREADLIAPVPLHRWRLLSRRYNQAALIAAQAARLTSVTHIPDLLLRIRATASQGAMSAAGRARNVAGAFRVHPRHAGRVKGARIVLIDDVLTTGATVGGCARVLKNAGAAGVDVLTLARVATNG